MTSKPDAEDQGSRTGIRRQKDYYVEVTGPLKRERYTLPIVKRIWWARHESLKMASLPYSAPFGRRGRINTVSKWPGRWRWNLTREQSVKRADIDSYLFVAYVHPPTPISPDADINQQIAQGMSAFRMQLFKERFFYIEHISYETYVNWIIPWIFRL